MPVFPFRAALAALLLCPCAHSQTLEALPPAERDSLRAAFDDAQHAVEPLRDGDLVARTRRHGYATRFDGRGARVASGDGAWAFELGLAAYGRADAFLAVDEPGSVTHADRRVEYRWSDELTEWYVNRNGGLEHGYTLHARPSGTGALAVDLDLVLGDGLSVGLVDAARTVEFTDATGDVVARYAGLVAFDADADDLDARFELAGERLRIVVDDTGASYPLTIDPIVQQARLLASNVDVFDQFAGAVAVSGDTLVVGATREDSSASSVDGDQSDNSSPEAGAAYVFVRTGTSWVQEAYLKPFNPDELDFFGEAVAISGDTIVVGAPWEDSSKTGVTGLPDNNTAMNSGAAYIFVRNQGVWSQDAYLKSTGTDAGDNFGTAVAVDGDTVVVGAPFEDSGATGVNGNPFDNSVAASGAAFVYTLSGAGSWVVEAYLKASNAGNGDAFGTSVSISGDLIAIGAPGERSSAIGVGGNQLSNGLIEAGAAYVFERSGTTWSQHSYIKASNTGGGDQFGNAIDVDGETLVVGAPRESSAATGVNGNQSDNSAFRSGAAYVFVRNGPSWSQLAYLKPTGTASAEAFDMFGGSVAVSQGTVAVGAAEEDGSNGGIDGNANDNLAPDSGAAYLYIPSGFTWAPFAYVKSSAPTTLAAFGTSVALDVDTLVAGAPIEDLDKGAAYVFDLDFVNPISGCFANPAMIHEPAVTARIGTTFPIQIEGNQIATGVAATFYGAIGVDAGGCGTLLGVGQEALLSLSPFPTLLGVVALTGGSGTQPLPIPNDPALIGIRPTFQAVLVDAFTGGSEISRGLEVEIRP